MAAAIASLFHMFTPVSAYSVPNHSSKRPHIGLLSVPWQVWQAAGSVIEGSSPEKSITPADQSLSFCLRNSTDS